MNSNVGNFLQNVFRSVFFCSAGHTSLSDGQPNQKLKRSGRRNRPPAAAEALESRTLLTSFSDQGALGMTGAMRGGGVWGDYDNDGDLDAVITGRTDAGDRVANIFRNDSGAFTDIAAGLANLSNGSASWGDYDRDGDLDLFISGVNSSAVNQSKLYRNNSGTFVEVAASFTGARYSSSSWGDFDNDGDLDLLLSGRNVISVGNFSNFTKIYRNDGGDTFTESAASLPGAAFGSTVWGDYDADGDLDILISGTNASGTRQTGIYRNDGNETFTDISAGLAVLNNSSAAWGDYDNDGDLDLLFNGQAGSGQPQSRIYRNDGSNTFTDIAAPLPNLFYGAVAWGDLDNDGDLDAFITGRTGVPTTLVTKVFVNNAGAFADDGSALAGFDLTSGGPGDYDNDGDLDLLISGRNPASAATVKVYRNDISAANTAPAAPGNLTAATSSPTSLTFSWSAPADTQTASAGLSYNLRVGTTPGGSDVYASMANASTGRSRIAARGPIQGTSYTLKGLTAGQTYYWSVQAVDPSFAGSAFATESSAGINAAPTAVSASPNPASIAENTSTSSRVKVADISITDDGRGSNSLSLSGTDQASFEIVGTELFLRAGVTLDFEVKTSYSIGVHVDDASLGGSPDASTTFTLNVTNVNEAPTAVTLQNTTPSLAEDASTAVAIKLADISVTDDALGTNVLSLTGTDAAFFEIVGTELRLKASTILNFEAKSTYDVTVEVNDATVGGAVDASQNFSLTITDVNEAPTAVTLQNTTTSLAENTDTSSAIKLADLTVTDDALGTNVRSVGGPDAAFFEIVGNELRLKASTVLDFETKSSYSITVDVNDATVGGAVDASANFTLTLTNVLDTTADADAFTFTFSTVDVVITHAINAGTPVSFGSFPLSSSIVLNGLAANDSVRVIGTSGADLFSVSSAGLVVNGTTLTLSGPALKTLVGGAGNDVYQFDADNVLGTWSLNESGGGTDTVDFSPTTTVGLAMNMAFAGIQPVHATNLSLSLGSGATFENAIGGDGADSLTGNSLDNTLQGGAGNDRLIGAAGSDSLLGGADDDTYFFGAALIAEADQVSENLNEGTDTLSFIFLTTSVSLNLGETSVQSVHTNRTLQLNSSNTFENASGGSGSDTLTGNTLNNALIGGAGDDALNGAQGSDLLSGGANNDTFSFDPSSSAEADQVTENANDGIDTLSFASLTTDIVVNLGSNSIQTVHLNRTLRLNSGALVESVVGGSGADTLFGNALNNSLSGGAGNDRLIGAAGNDLMLGGADNDTYFFGPAAAAEADQVNENPNEGSDMLNFGSLTTNVALNLGDNSVQSVHVNRTLGLNSAVTIENAMGGSGADTLIGNSLNNTLTGGAGDDTLNGALGNDLLFGGANSDTYLFGPAASAEADQVAEIVSDGIDTLDFASLTTDIVVNLGSNSIQPVHLNRTLRLNSGVLFENVVGGSGADTLFGNSLNNTLSGGAGNDRLIGAAGNDVLQGGANDDTYFFGVASLAESDQLTENANEGIDTLNFANLTTDVVLNLGSALSQQVHVNRTVSLNSNSAFENAMGGTGNDTLLGNESANHLAGGNGDNILVGLESGDILESGSGRDILIAGAGLDVITGGAGEDILIAGQTTMDTNVGSLNTLRTAWVSTDTYEVRVASLRTGVGSPLVSLKTTIDVLNDGGEDDVLFGGSDSDWFFRALDDVITDLVTGELVDVL